MDRFYLAALVCEIAARVIGKRGRGLTAWNPAGFFIPLNMKDKSGLVVSLTPEAPGFYLGAPPLPPSEIKPRERLTKLLVGSELSQLRSTKLDRIVHIEWRRAKPSGVELHFELIVEWLGTRNAAYLIDKRSTEVLDLIAHGKGRLSPGQLYESPEPPPGVGPLVPDSAEFLGRLDRLREKGVIERRAVREASGFSPLLADEVVYLRSERGITYQEAFESVRNRLTSPCSVVYHPPGSLRDEKARYRLSPVQLEHLGRGEECSTLNSGASRFIGLSTRLVEARRRWHEIQAGLLKRTKRQKALLKRLEYDRGRLEDPQQLRRWGELLLAGLSHARRVEGGVEVPDPYHSGGEGVCVPLDPRFDLPTNAQRFFQRSRKVERGLKKMKSRISTLKNELDHLETLELMLENAGSVEELDDLVAELREAGALALPAGVGKSRRSASASLGPHRFVSALGGVILAGRSARSNEELTFKIARPNELWFHAKGSAGAHVVLRRRDKEPASRAEIEEAAGVAAYYSKSRGSTYVEVLYTLRKNVRKISGAPPGTVRLASHQSVRVRPALPKSLVISHQSSADVSHRPVRRSLGEGGSPKPECPGEGGSPVDSSRGPTDEKDEL